MMHAWTTVAADGQGEREARFGYTVPRVLCVRSATRSTCVLPRPDKHVCPVEHSTQ